jgi:hypothetical protein
MFAFGHDHDTTMFAGTPRGLWSFKVCTPHCIQHHLSYFITAAPALSLGSGFGPLQNGPRKHAEVIKASSNPLARKLKCSAFSLRDSEGHLNQAWRSRALLRL